MQPDSTQTASKVSPSRMGLLNIRKPPKVSSGVRRVKCGYLYFRSQPDSHTKSTWEAGREERQDGATVPSPDCFQDYSSWERLGATVRCRGAPQSSRRRQFTKGSDPRETASSKAKRETRKLPACLKGERARKHSKTGL